MYVPSVESTSEYALTRGIWDSGAAGVDLFFVISGFIMVYVTRDWGRSAADVKRFLWARVTRIYPLWWFYALLMAGYFMVAYNMPGPPDRVAGSAEAWGYLIRSLALWPQEAAPVLGLGWSLIHEVHFYIVFAGCLFIPRCWLPWVLTVWAIIIFGANFAGIKSYVSTDWKTLVFSRLSLEFIAGALAGYWISRLKIVWPGYIAIFGAVTFIAGLAWRAYTENFWPGRVMLYAVPCAALLYGVTALETQGRLRTPRVLKLLGDWSYSLYLSHFFVLIGLRRIMRECDPYIPERLRGFVVVGSDGPVDNIIHAITVIALAVILAGLSYRFIERPLIRFFRKRRHAVPAA